MSAFQISAVPGGQWPHARLRLAGHRCHHGMIGAVLVALGGVLCWHDRRDAPWLR